MKILHKVSGKLLEIDWKGAKLDENGYIVIPEPKEEVEVCARIIWLGLIVASLLVGSIVGYGLGYGNGMRDFSDELKMQESKLEMEEYHKWDAENMLCGFSSFNCAELIINGNRCNNVTVESSYEKKTACANDLYFEDICERCGW